MQPALWAAILIPLVLLLWLVAQVMPTPRDRQLNRLRAHARGLGLAVHVRRVPDPDPEPEARVSGGGGARDPRLEVAVYTRPLRLPAGIERRHVPAFRALAMPRHADEVLVPGLPAGWRLERSDLPLLDPVLAELGALLVRTPRGTVTVEGTASGCSVAWRERGETDEVDALAAVLDDLRGFQLALARKAVAREAAPDAD